MVSKQVLPAMYWGKAFFKRVAQDSFKGAVHSVFAKVCNLCTDEGELFSLAIPEVGNSPNGLLVRFDHGQNFLSWEVQSATRFQNVGSNLLLVGSYAIDLSKGILWTEEILPQPHDAEQIRRNLEILRRQVTVYGSPEGLGNLLIQQYFKNKIILQKVDAAYPALCQALRSNDNEALFQAACLFIGLGPGLTPAGDDFLSGFMLGLYWGGKALGVNNSNAQQWDCREIVRAAKSRTNLISFTQILYACVGQTREVIYSLLKSLYYSSNEKELKIAIDRVLQIGSTSGSDIMAGIGRSIEFILAEQTLDKRGAFENC